eukprot:TRINITY_DN8175_c0_g1_i1.p1 TRINITY_DN8175_c0_g1~~TRINITY_DN8175_c0_g1_i1.p1  ORF type:complete len:412 (-),score=73.95 TRINITY_DN8175_c0_g1_i1:241-1476(-)
MSVSSARIKIKRRKVQHGNEIRAESDDVTDEADSTTKVIAQFVSDAGESVGPEVEVPINISHDQLETLLNHLQNNQDEKNPYSFFINDAEIIGNLKNTFVEQNCTTEKLLKIVFQPQAVFRVKAITRNTGSLSGHSEAVLCVAFSPDGTKLASGSGDTTVRFWDVDTNTPTHTCRGHTNWVLSVAWSPDGKKLASGGNDNAVRIWDPETGKQIGSALQGHKRYVTAIAWEPYHKNPDCVRLATSSKDGTVKIWDTRHGKCVLSLSSHTMSVTCIRWGGEDLIYSGSQDRSIKVWDAKEGKLVRTLDGHAHWVNTLALNTDYVLRTGPFDHYGKKPDDKEEARQAALKRWQDVVKFTDNTERLISGSDDFTMFMWEPTKSKKSTARLVGHQQVINMVSFSPDGRVAASASFD